MTRWQQPAPDCDQCHAVRLHGVLFHERGCLAAASQFTPTTETKTMESTSYSACIVPRDFAAEFIQDRLANSQSPRLWPMQKEHRRNLIACGFVAFYGEWVGKTYSEIFRTKHGQTIEVCWFEDGSHTM